MENTAAAEFVPSPDEPLLNLVAEVFQSQAWELKRPEPDSTVLQIEVPDNPRHDLWVRTAEADQLLTVFTVMRADVPPDRVADIVELAVRLNGAVAVGSYEVNFDTGLLSFKTGIDVQGDRLSVALVRQLVGTALVAAQRALPLMEAVLDGTMDPRSAAKRL